eukprot:Hpha_TRINITY_DN16668_c0_g4::TRINITY_DN16668_c0_g4_i1::g.178207::m.178207/K01135/ARSB; arylsulfatase B
MMLGVVAAVCCAVSKPNILLIVSDDQGYADVDFNSDNDSAALTPHLRDLALSGIRLTNHHVQQFCSPTRAALMTGRHVLRYGLNNAVIHPKYAYAVPQNETLLAQNLKDAGYHTSIIGKWHLGLYKNWSLPQNRGFEEQYGYYLGAEDYWTHARNGGLDWHRNGELVTSENGTYSAGLLGKAAVEYLTRRGPLGPWFLYLPFQSVHAPLQAPQEYIDKYPDLTGGQQIRMAMVTAVDDQIGLVMNALRTTAQLNRTVVVFTSDNGAPLGDSAVDEGYVHDVTSHKRRPQKGDGNPPHGQGGGSNWPYTGWKTWLYEGGTRTAAIIRAPGLEDKAGTEHNGLFHAVDWLPTLVGLAGGKTEGNLPLDGYDLWDALVKGGNASPREEVPVNIAACGGIIPLHFSEVQGPQAAIIVGEMKLLVDCFWRGENKVTSTNGQLYNLTADPAEENDLSATRPDDLQRLAARLAYWEAQAVPPYMENGDDKSCGSGGPIGSPPHWDPWC